MARETVSIPTLWRGHTRHYVAFDRSQSCMSDCPQSPTGHELDVRPLFGEPDDPVELRQRANCIHCGERMWIVYERSHVESCPTDDRGYPLQTDL